jgi:hypothetical protein
MDMLIGIIKIALDEKISLSLGRKIKKKITDERTIFITVGHKRYQPIIL